MRVPAIAVLAALGLALAACGTFERQATEPTVGELNEFDQGSLSPFSWSPNECAGKNCARVWLPQDGGPAVAEIIGAKEQSSITMTYNPKTGDVQYSATDTKGLDAQNFAFQADAALAKELGDLWTNLAPEIRTGVVCALGLAFGFPAACGG